MPQQQRTLLKLFGVSPEYVTEVVVANPSLRGIMIGYIAERKLWDWFSASDRVTALRKDDDHDRDSKGDLVVTCKTHDFRIEVKSLQTNSIHIYDPDAKQWIKKVSQEARGPLDQQKMGRRKWIEAEPFKTLWLKGPSDAQYKGNVQCDVSDRRVI